MGVKRRSMVTSPPQEKQAFYSNVNTGSELEFPDAPDWLA